MKLIIDIPDNELKDPLKNIHLLISDGIVTEVCIKKYDKDNPYFMNLNYAPLEKCEDCISRQAAIDIVVCDILSSAVVCGRTEEGMSARKAIVDGLKRLPSVTPAEKPNKWMAADVLNHWIGAEVLDKIRDEIVHLHDWAFDREEILRIIDKYREPEEEKCCSNCKFWCLDANDKNRRCKYCYNQDEWQAESEVQDADSD